MRCLYLHHSDPAPLPELAEACLALTPKVAITPHALFLDIGTTERAMGGEDRQLERLRDILDTFGIRPGVVVTDRPEWAPSLAAGSWLIVPRGESRERLLRLPLEALQRIGCPSEAKAQERERAQLIAFMLRVGMKTIADLTRLRPQAVNRRFGKLGESLLDWVLGRREFLIPTFQPEEPIEESLETEEVGSLETLLFLARQMLRRVEARLTGRGMLAQELRLSFTLDSGDVVVRSLRLAEPLREAAGLLRLLRDFLGGLTWETPLVHLRLEIPRMIPVVGGQLSLFDDGENRLGDLGQYVNRLRARFGEGAVGFARLRESYLPEESWELQWPPAAHAPLPERFPERPLFLLDPPTPIPSPRGPLFPTEHLASQWWEGVGDRHYYIYPNAGGRLWIYWDGRENRWYLHGIFE